MKTSRPQRLLFWFARPFYGPEQGYWRPVLVCFLAASTIWVLNALNKTYTTRISYPVEWVYDAARYVPVQDLPPEVTVNVTGRGWKLLRKNIMPDVRPAEMRLTRLPSQRYVLSSALRPALQNAMDGLQLNYLLSDTLWIEFDKLVRRRVPLTLSRAADGSALPYAAQFEPATIMFEGPASVVNALASPYPVHLPQAPAGSSSGSISVPIGGPAMVSTNVRDVRVRLRPRAVVTVPVWTTPELRDFPAQRRFRLQPATVQVQLQSFPEDTAALDLQRLRVALYFGQLVGPDSVLTPMLIETPEQARGARIVTSQVKVSMVRE